MGFLIQIVEGASVPETAVNSEILGIAVERNCIWPIGLQLDGIRASLLGFLDDCQCCLQATVMISRQFGDYIWRSIRRNSSTSNFDYWQLIRHGLALA